jgi:uncharacterized peroxidase-related enzyme
MSSANVSPDVMSTDVIDRAAGLKPGDRLFAARRFRETAIAHTQASHDALLHEPVAGWPLHHRLQVAIAVCEAAGADSLATHYRALLDQADAGKTSAPVAAAVIDWARWLTTHPHRNGRATIDALRDAGLGDSAIVALAQLVAFIAYQLRVVAGLKAIALPEQAAQPQAAAGPGARAGETGNASAGVLASAAETEGEGARAGGSGHESGGAPAGTTRNEGGRSQGSGGDRGEDGKGGSVSGNAGSNPSSHAATAPAAANQPIRIRGFTNESLQWHSWLHPVDVAQATPEQLAVLDESHPQARTSAYYLTLVHQPRMLQHRSLAYNAIMYASGGLPRAERELGAMVVSVTNGCVYCTSVHAQRYAQLARRTDTVEQVFTDPSTAGSTPRERAIASFAQALTLDPSGLGSADLADLRALGMGDEDLIDLTHAVAIFGWANRLMHNLGEPAGAGG